MKCTSLSRTSCSSSKCSFFSSFTVFVAEVTDLRTNDYLCMDDIANVPSCRRPLNYQPPQ
jgi:hypothetical protein